MPSDRDMMIAELERETGGTVTTAPPVITSSGGWRATLRGGPLTLVSVTLGQGSSEEDALTELGAKVVEAQQRLGITH